MAHRSYRYDGFDSFCVAVATIFGLLLIGLWDNQRTLQRALNEGYDATAVVQLIRNNRLPVAPGWRPRFLGTSHTVDLAWRGRDGVQRMMQRVPVSDAFIGDLMARSLDRVAIRTLDESNAVPAILSDADNRLRAIGASMPWAVWGTLGAVIGFVGTLIWRRVRQQVKASALSGEVLAPPGHAIRSPAGRATVVPPPPPRAPRAFPYRLLIVTLFALVFGATMSISAWLDRHGYDAIRDHGTEAIAWITDAHALASGGTQPRISHAIDLAWRDGSGNERRFRPTHISEQFWAGISSRETVVRRQVRIRYLEDDRGARPLIAGDVTQRRVNDSVGIFFGGLALSAGLVLSAFTIRRMRPI
jgi:hypothetical protein